MNHLVLLSDFGLQDHFVASMKAVAYGVDPVLRITDLSHSVETYNIWEAGVLLARSMPVWSAGTVFTAVVDPGVGTERRALAVRTVPGHFLFCPDNGLLSFIDLWQGIAEVREIDAVSGRRPGSEGFHTFHGRDLFVYMAARLASGKIRFADSGSIVHDQPVRLPYKPPVRDSKGTVRGTILKVEKPFGNLVTDITRDFTGLPGKKFSVTILEKERTLFRANLVYVRTFGEIQAGDPLLYMDSCGFLGIALNQGNLAEGYALSAGKGVEILLDEIRE